MKRTRRRRKRDEMKKNHELVEKDFLQEYALVLKMLGNARLTAFCFDGKTRLCRIRGSMRKKIQSNIVCTNDVVLVSLREYQDYRADVIFKYPPKDVHKLKLPKVQFFCDNIFAGYYVDSSVYTGDFDNVQSDVVKKGIVVYRALNQ